jgi:hypothetical protein
VEDRNVADGWDEAAYLYNATYHAQVALVGLALAGWALGAWGRRIIAAVTEEDLISEAVAEFVRDAAAARGVTPSAYIEQAVAEYLVLTLGPGAATTRRCRTVIALIKRWEWNAAKYGNENFAALADGGVTVLAALTDLPEDEIKRLLKIEPRNLKKL